MDSDEDSYHDEYSYGDDVEEIDDSGSEAAEETDSGEEEEELAEYGGGRNSSRRRQKHYTILTEERIRQLQDNDISQVSSLLSVSKTLACTLLRRHNWSISAVSDKWFSDEEKLLFPQQELLNPLPPDNNNNLCNICFEEISGENMLSCPCGHPFCSNCWKYYIMVSINDGPGCLSLSCPEPGCKSSVGPELVDSLASDEDKERYYRYFLRSYVECHGNTRWCPAPRCDRAVQIETRVRENYDVACDCSHRFCWNCAEECHRPVDCKTVAEWIELSSSEEEDINTATWIMAFTKPCPGCGINIEKDQGCNHMICRRPCRQQFCWLCLQPWENHTHASCNEKKECNKKFTRARKNLSKFGHHYEGWVSNHMRMRTAVSDLRTVLDDKLGGEYSNYVKFGFLIEALEQIVECRSMLKWSYVYGYYLSLTKKATKIEFFEFLQKQAEVNIERLHRCADKDIEMYVNNDFDRADFVGFRRKVVNLTNVTRNYFEEWVRAL
ncbi:hypothetical protein ACP275_06G159900 [Erythranthe tilingii]